MISHTSPFGLHNSYLVFHTMDGKFVRVESGFICHASYHHAYLRLDLYGLLH